VSPDFCVSDFVTGLTSHAKSTIPYIIAIITVSRDRHRLFHLFTSFQKKWWL